MTRRVPILGSFVAVAIILVVCAGVIQQTRVLKILRQSHSYSTQQHTDNVVKSVNVGNMTLDVTSSITPEYPSMQQPKKSKARRESREQTNQRSNIRPSKSASVRRPPVTNSTRKIMYIHVGKTGGYTLDTVFRSNCAWYGLTEPKQDCYRNFNHQNTSVDSVLSHLTKSTVHITPRHHYDRWINETTAFLFSIRNPIDRAVSAFDMDHTMNNNLTGKTNLKNSRQPFYDCFPTAEHLARGLFDDNNSTTTSKKAQCTTLGWNILTGNRHDNSRGAIVTHLYYNYRSYMNITLDKYPNKEVMVVRTEHLWDDTSKLDIFLGGTGEFQKAGHQFDHGRAKYLIKSKLTADEKQHFCRALQDEIAIYKMLIEKAVNLNATEKEESLDVLRKDCGTAWVD